MAGTCASGAGEGAGYIVKLRELQKPQEYLSNSFDELVATFGGHLDEFVIALLLALAGLLLARIARWLILRVGTGLDRLTQGTRLGAAMRLRWPLSSIVAGAVYWLVLLLFLMAAAQSLGLPGLTESIHKLLAYLPTIFVAGLILFAGLLLGGLARDRVVAGAGAARVAHAELLGSMVRFVVVLLTIVVGLDQMGAEVRLVEYLLVIFVAAALSALALAFGLGAGPTVTNIIAVRNVRRHYQPGQWVRVGEIEGKILELSSAFVVLETERGRTLVPARVFEEQVSVLLDSEVEDEH